MDIYEIVMKLIGPVHPVGETQIDDVRYENLQKLLELNEKLRYEIYSIACENKDRQEYSRKRAGKLCEQFRIDMEIEE